MNVDKYGHISSALYQSSNVLIQSTLHPTDPMSTPLNLTAPTQKSLRLLSHHAFVLQNLKQKQTRTHSPICLISLGTIHMMA